MPFVWVGLIMVILKYLEVGPLASLSWWWVIAPLAVAFAWFEGLEKLFGFDRRVKEHDAFEKARKDRFAKTFATNTARTKK